MRDITSTPTKRGSSQQSNNNKIPTILSYLCLIPYLELCFCFKQYHCHCILLSRRFPSDHGLCGPQTQPKFNLCLTYFTGFLFFRFHIWFLATTHSNLVRVSISRAPRVFMGILDVPSDSTMYDLKQIHTISVMEWIHARDVAATQCLSAKSSQPLTVD